LGKPQKKKNTHSKGRKVNIWKYFAHGIFSGPTTSYSGPTTFSSGRTTFFSGSMTFYSGPTTFYSGPTTFYPRPTTFYPQPMTFYPRLFTHDPRLLASPPKCNNTYASIVKEVLPLPSTRPYNNFSRSRSRSKHLTHVKSRDREPSRIPVKKLVHLMSKNRKSRHVIKRFIKQSIPKSSCFHNLLSTRYQKDIIQQQTNAYMWKFRKPFHAKSTKSMSKTKRRRVVVHKQLSMSMHNLASLKNSTKHARTRKHKLFTSNSIKLKVVGISSSKCNMQRIKTSDRNCLIVSGDVELNPGPVNTSNMSILTTRLARIGRKPVNIVGDGNCLFRSVSHQLYRTKSRHAQIRALAIQLLRDFI
jgi:hypothetical protein